MRRLAGIAVLGAVLVEAAPYADACGDKLLSIARGIRLNQTYKAKHPTSILMYVGDVSAAKSSKKEYRRLVQMSILYMSLRQAGHRIQAVQNADELRQSLDDFEFDFLMADLNDVGTVAVPVAAGVTEADVVPILFKPKKSKLGELRGEYELVLKTPATSVDHLEAIDDVMASRALVTAGH